MSLLTALLAIVLVVIILMMYHNTAFEGNADTTHTFFEQFIMAGGHIVWFVLLPMSFATIYLSAEHFLTIRRKKLLPLGINDKIVQDIRNLGLQHLNSEKIQDSNLITTALTAASNQVQTDWFRMRNTIFESLQEQGLKLMRRIEWLNLIGNVSPMVGLFGTVFGMIKLFNAIVVAGGQPQPAQLADGISVALVTTFWGLLIAIPALTIHGIFRNRIEALLSDAVTEVEKIMPSITNAAKQQQKASRTPIETSSPKESFLAPG